MSYFGVRAQGIFPNVCRWGQGGGRVHGGNRPVWWLVPVLTPHVRGPAGPGTLQVCTVALVTNINHQRIFIQKVNK